eukprot:Skav211601  [mRNA]  locus=scaffold2962:88747:94237:- [translate_table: standard]
MTHEALQPDPVTVTVTLRSLRELGLWPHAAEVYQRSVECSVQSNVITFNTILSCSGGQWESALAFLHRMAGIQIKADDVSCNTVLSTCEKSKKWQGASHVLSVMRTTKLRSDVISQSTTISACGDLWPLALALRLELDTWGIETNIIAENSCVSSVKEWESTLTLGLRSFRSLSLRPSPNALSAVICAAPRWEMVLATVALAWQLNAMDSTLLNAAFDAAGSAAWQFGVLALASGWMTTKRCAVGNASFGAVMTACSRAWQWRSSLAILQMNICLKQADFISFSAAMSALEKVADEIHFGALIGACDPEAFTPVAGAGRAAHSVHVSEGVVLLSSLCLVSVLEGADMALLPAVFYALQTDLGLSLTDLATMTLVQAESLGVTTSAVAPFWGILADRGIMKRRDPELLGALLASLRPVASGIIADVTSEQRRGKVAMLSTAPWGALGPWLGSAWDVATDHDGPLRSSRSMASCSFAPTAG